MKKLDELFHLTSKDRTVGNIGLIATAGVQGLAQEIDWYLKTWGEEDASESYILSSSCPRFSSGDSKGIIDETVRGRDLYFLVDVGNYSCTYPLFGMENHMSPDDHFQDLKRLIQASGGKASRMTVIMPLLYGGRQHRRVYRESLDAAYMLQELHAMGVTNLITFDAHDPRVQNAVPLMGIDNVIPYYQVIKTLKTSFPDIEMKKDSFMIISPDEGAMTRNMYYSSVLGVDLGMFYKRRDYSRMVNGHNPIVAHEYLGSSVDGKDVFITDDMISSGESVLDIAYALKKKNAKRIYCYATYAIFTNGLDAYDKAYKDGLISGVLGTNLTYCPPALLEREWYYQVNVSKYIAYFITALNHENSVSSIIDPHKKIEELLKR